MKRPILAFAALASALLALADDPMVVTRLNGMNMEIEELGVSSASSEQVDLRGVPASKVTNRSAEIASCRRFLAATIAHYPNLRAIVTLGTIAHQSTVRALGLRVADFPFSHGAHRQAGRVALFSSYHCSRYNTNTGRLTEEMFIDVFAAVRDYLDGPAGVRAPTTLR